MSKGRLETVVRVRELQERIARGEVAREQRAARARQQDVVEASDAVASRADMYHTSPTAFAAHRAMLDVGRREVGVAEQRHESAIAEVERSIEFWTAASRQLEGIQRLEQRLNEERRALEAQKAQAEIDDMVITRWKPGTG